MRPGDHVSDGLTSEQAKAVTETILDGEVPVFVHASTEEEFAAALNAGAFVSADPEILDAFGMADHGENVVELEEIFPDLLP